MESNEHNRSNDEQDLSNFPPMPVWNDDLPVQAEPIFSFPNLATVVIAAGGMFLLVAALTPSVQGATRSAKLKWQEQQAEMHQAKCEAGSDNLETDHVNLDDPNSGNAS
jgi:hypothetical protein